MEQTQSAGLGSISCDPELLQSHLKLFCLDGQFFTCLGSVDFAGFSLEIGASEWNQLGTSGQLGN
jgi:hypothetical protein